MHEDLERAFQRFDTIKCRRYVTDRIENITLNSESVFVTELHAELLMHLSEDSIPRHVEMFAFLSISIELDLRIDRPLKHGDFGVSRASVFCQ